jgi:cardiolipin synthase A/B
MPGWLAAAASVVHLASAIGVTFDAVLRKRHVQSVIGWIGIAWLAPFFGAIAYLGFGINRIRRAATRRHPGPVAVSPAGPAADVATLPRPDLARLGDRAVGEPLLAGNAVEPLVDGDAAFPAMLAAIDDARTSVSLVSYLFDADPVGELFADALAGAVARGVAVRVLVDGVGQRYSRPAMPARLRRRGVTAAAFLPTRVPRLFRYANLRNHRKILVVDGRVGFTGGMNLREGHWLARAPRAPARCLHFRVEGPVVRALQATFVEDWAFATRERLAGDAWFPPLAAAGSVAARAVPAGPDEDLGRLPDLLLGALAAARDRVRIVTPYFLPDEVLLRALHVTALRGVDVTVLLPERSNVPLIDAAMRWQLRELLGKGVRVLRSPPPFDHTKLFVVDGLWSLVGSTNWDARSLRLNFEFNLDCHDAGLATRLEALVDERIAVARPVTVRDLPRGLPARLVAGVARLAGPYL